MGRALVLVVLVGLAACGCTFAGLADYPIEECLPNAASQAEDRCDRLNHDDPESCRPWQCDAATRRCVQRPRDDDRDGDPSLTCGGADCDDHDPTVSGHGAELCDGKDNDCDGLVDEEVVGPGGSTTLSSLGVLSSWADPWLGGANGRDLFASWATSSHCVEAASLKSGGGPLASECLFAAEKTLAPRQPQVVLVGGAPAAVMVTTSGGCSALRYSTGATGGWQQSCSDAAPGAALPALAAFPTQRAALVTWYAVDPSARVNPISSCEGAAPAPLRALVLGATGMQPLAGPLTLVPDGVSLRPPALVAAGDGLLVAAPGPEGVALVTLSAAGVVGATVTLTSLEPVRAVSLSMAPDGKRLALAVETGCTPQALAFAVGTWDAALGVRFGELRELAPRGSGLQVQPTVAWIEARQEWLFTWIADGPKARARRFTADGIAVGEAFDVGPARAAVAAADGNVYELVDQPDAQLVQTPVGCGGGSHP